MTKSSPFAGLMLEVAELLWGAPRKERTPTEVRFGQGRTVNPADGTWFDHPAHEGGGVFDLVVREGMASDRAAAARWLKEKGFSTPDDRGDAPRQERPRAVPSRREDPPFEPDPPKKDDGARKTLVKSWDYVDEAGRLAYQALRYQFKLPDGSWRVDGSGKVDKTFSQRRPARQDDDPSKVRDGWVYSIKGERIVPYRLPELIEAVASGYVVFLTEGEKAADALAALGVPATCNPMGAGKWWDSLTPFFEGADIVIVGDNDEPGRKHVRLVGSTLSTVAERVRVLDLPDLPPKGDAVEWVEAGGDAGRLYDLADAAPPFDPLPDADAADELPREFSSRFGAVLWRDLDAPGPEHEWLVKGLVTRGEVAMLAGPSQSGKSFLAIDLAMAIARGTTWMGRKVRRGGVIYQAGESAKGVRRKRLPAYRQWHALRSEDDVPFVLLQRPVDLYSSDDATKAMVDEIRHWSASFTVPLELVVIDTFAAATTGADENSAKDIGPVLARCQRISEQTGATVLLVHHLNAGGERVRGHSSIKANLDSVLICKKREDAKDDDGRQIREIAIDKAKDGESEGKWTFVLRSVEIGRDEDGDPITSCVVAEPRSGEQPVGAKGWTLTTAQYLFATAMAAALRDHGVPPVADLDVGRSVSRVVSYDAVKLEYRARSQFDGDANDIQAVDAFRKRLTATAKRVREELTRGRVIEARDGLIWFTGRPIANPPPELTEDVPLPPEAVDDDPLAY